MRIRTLPPKALTTRALCLLLAAAWALAPALGQPAHVSLPEKVAFRPAEVRLPSSEDHLAKLDRTITLDLERVGLEEALERIARLGGLRLVYDADALPADRRVTLREGGVTVMGALHEAARGTGLQFKLSPSGHLLVAAGAGGPDVGVAEVVRHAVRGTVTSEEEGTPLPGVNVVVRGTTLGTITDADGAYALDAPEPTDTLVFSFVGFLSREVPIAGRSEVDVALAVDNVALDEVVVVGYGAVRKSDLTGSVSSIDADEIDLGVTSSVDQLIAGRAAGVQVTQASSEPGGGVTVRIRGTGSINAGNEPLYVIDGLPIDNGAATPGSPINQTVARNPLNALSPDDIASIEILKDASATAIYGSRGANGVVLITTKNGNRDGLQINYEGYYGVQNVARQLDMLGAGEYVALLNDLRRDMGEEPEFSPEEAAAIGRGTDWQEEVLRSAPVMSHHLSFSGGGQSNRYYASLGYFDQEGVVISSGMKKYLARVNLEQSAGDRLRVGLNVNASYIDDDFVPFGTNINENAGVLSSAIYLDPTMGITGEGGRYLQSSAVNLENPVGFAYGVDDFAETNRTFGNAFAELDLLPGLMAKANLGADRQTSQRDTYVSTVTRRGAENNGIAEVQTNARSSFLAEFTLNYNRQLGPRHRVDLLGGYTYQTFSRSFVVSEADDFVSDAFGTGNLGAGARETFGVGSGRTRNQLVSYLARANYSLADRYLLTASIRADGSSRFGEDNKFGYFPSFAFAWRLINEEWVSNLERFDDLKLRLSYGITGNQEIGNYNSLVLLGPQGEAYFNETPNVGVAPFQIANPDLRWETTRQFDVGLDFGFFDGRVTGSVDYFLKNTSDLLLNLPISETTGFSSVLQNVGGVRNSGFELALSTYNVTGGDVEWTTSFNASTIRNEVTSLAGLPFILQGGAGFVSNVSILREGDPVNAYFGYVVDGTFQLDDDIASSPQPEARPGEIEFRDVDGDGAITPEDRTVLGSPFPDFTFGLTNDLTYKRFSLNVFVQGVLGHELMNLNLIESENPISFRRNRLREAYTDRWTPDNPTNDQPSGIPPQTSYGSVNNSRAVEDASFVRLRNVELRYRVPTRFASALRSASVYLAAQNLLTLTGYSGFDPEVSAFGSSNVRIDYNAYPLARTFSAGVRLGL